MASVTMDAGSRLDIGKVIEQTFAVLRRNFASFGLAALIFVGIPALLLGLIQFNDLTHPGGGESFSRSGGGIVTAFSSAFLQAAIIYGVSRDMRGDRATLKDCLSVGGKKWRDILVLSIVMGLGILLGLILLVIPGIIVALAWSVAVPVRVVEGLGLRASLRRSAELTRGRRWIIFLLGLLIGVFYMIVGAVAFGLTGGLVKGPTNPILIVVLNPFIQIATSLLGAVMVAVLYQQLREGRVGVSVETLAEVFD